MDLTGERERKGKVCATEMYNQLLGLEEEAMFFFFFQTQSSGLSPLNKRVWEINVSVQSRIRVLEPALGYNGLGTLDWS